MKDVLTEALFYHRYTPIDLAEELRAGDWTPIRYYRRRWSPWLPAGRPKAIELHANAFWRRSVIL
jgi:hypothetical protein